MFMANISEINPLVPGNYVIVLHPGTKMKEILIGEGMLHYFSFLCMLRYI